MNDRLMTLPELSRLLGLSRATVYRQIAADPAFPRPVKIGRATRFRESEAQSYIASGAGRAMEAGR